MEMKQLGRKPQNSSIFEDRLRNEIEQNSMEWRSIKDKLDKLRKARNLPNGVVLCIAKLRKSTLDHFKYDPLMSDSFPLVLVPEETTVAEVQTMIRAGLQITTHIGLSVMHGQRLLVPSVIMSQLPPAYDQILFLNYTQTDPF